MATAYGSIATATQNSGTGTPSLTITKPASLAAGDLMIAILGIHGSATHYTASGWTEVLFKSYGTPSAAVTVLAKVASSGDAAASDFTFSISGVDNIAKIGHIVRVTGNSFVGTENIQHDEDGSDFTTSHVYSGGVTPPLTSSLLIMGVIMPDLVNFSSYAIANNNPTWTERADSEINSTQDMTLAVATAPFAVQSATGNYSLTSSGSGDTAAFLLCVTETTDVTPAPAVIEGTLNIVAPSVAAAANVAPSVITGAFSVEAPTVTLTPTKWSNPDKNLETFTNPDKS